jgi:hypothetical protein
MKCKECGEPMKCKECGEEVEKFFTCGICGAERLCEGCANLCVEYDDNNAPVWGDAFPFDNVDEC